MFTEKQIGVSALVVTMLIFSSSGSVFQRILNAEKSGAACNTTETYNTSNTSNCSNDVAVVFTACNMLCGSNLIGLVTLPPLFRSDLTMKNIYAVRVLPFVRCVLFLIFFVHSFLPSFSTERNFVLLNNCTDYTMAMAWVNGWNSPLFCRRSFAILHCG